MQIKIYVPKTIEIPSEYLAGLAQRARDTLGKKGNDVPATRGHLVRQAVADGLLRELDALMGEDGSVDTFVDPQGELPLEIENRQVTLSELLVTLQGQKAATTARHGEEISQFKGGADATLTLKQAA